MDTSGTKIWLPGISDTATLDAASALCGTTAMKETRNILGPHYDRHDLYTRHPVMSPDMISQLPARYALVLRGGMSPVIARLPMAWHDPAYKRARRAGHATAVLTAAEPAGLFRDCRARASRGTGTTPRLTSSRRCRRDGMTRTGTRGSKHTSP